MENTPSEQINQFLQVVQDSSKNLPTIEVKITQACVMPFDPNSDIEAKKPFLKFALSSSSLPISYKDQVEDL